MINYHVGNLFDFISDKKNIIIAHIVNNVGAWGAGFVVQLGKKYPLAKNLYKQAIKDQHITLGSCQSIEVDKENNIYVANLVAQDNRNIKKNRLVNYASLAYALDNLLMRCNLEKYKMNKDDNFEFWMPLIGCGIGGGDWNIVKELISDIFPDDISINVCVLEDFQLPPIAIHDYHRDLWSSTRDFVCKKCGKISTLENMNRGPCRPQMFTQQRTEETVCFTQTIRQ